MSAPTSRPSFWAFSSSMLFMAPRALGRWSKHERRRPGRDRRRRPLVAQPLHWWSNSHTRGESRTSGRNCVPPRRGRRAGAGPAANAAGTAAPSAEEGGDRLRRSALLQGGGGGDPFVAVRHEDIGAEADEDHLADAAGSGRRGPDRLHRDAGGRPERGAEEPGADRGG